MKQISWVGVNLGLEARNSCSFQESSAVPLVVTDAGSPAFIKGKENVTISTYSSLQMHKVAPLTKKQTFFC